MMLTIAHAMQRFYLVSSSLAVGVGSLLPAEGGDDVDEAAVVLNASPGTAGLLLLLLLLLHFGGLSLDFAGTREGTVHFAAEKTGSHLDGRQLREGLGGRMG